MNVATATSPVSAPGAGVLPGTPAGATPGAGPSFAEVLRQLAGGTPVGITGGWSSRAAAGDAPPSASDADESGDDVAAASVAVTAAMGAMIVPVAFVPSPVTELPSADAADRPSAPTSTSSANETEVSAPEAGAAGASATDGEPAAAPSSEHRAAASLERLVGAAGHAAAGGARRAGYGAADTSASWSDMEPTGPSASSGAPPVVELGPTVVATTGIFTGIPTGTTTGATFDSATAFVAAEAPATSALQATGMVARAVAGITRDPGRAVGLPQAPARLLDHDPVAGTAPAAPAGSGSPVVGDATAAISDGLETLVDGVAGQVAPAVAAAFRGQHPALSAALRAFQQAGAAVAGGSTEDAAAGIPTGTTTGSTTGATFDSATAFVAAEAPATSALQATGMVARAVAGITRDPGRAVGLPQAPARLLDHDPVAGTAPAAPAGSGSPVVGDATAAISDGLETLVDGVAGQVAPAVAAAFRGQHPALSAALRAFQQAGAAVAGGSTEDAAASVTASVSQLIAAAREAAFTGGAAETTTPAAEGGRRALTGPAMAATTMPAIMPALGGDLRVGSGLGPSARPDATGGATLTAAEGADVSAQLVQSIRVQWTGGAGEARVRLRPEHLGEVVAIIKVEQGAVTATLQAERPDVRRWLEAHTQTLREGLVEHGLKLDRLVVLTEPARGDTRDDTQGRARGRHPQQPQQRPRRPRRDDSGATFDLNT